MADMKNYVIVLTIFAAVALASYEISKYGDKKAGGACSKYEAGTIAPYGEMVAFGAFMLGLMAWLCSGERGTSGLLSDDCSKSFGVLMMIHAVLMTGVGGLSLAAGFSGDASCTSWGDWFTASGVGAAGVASVVVSGMMLNQ